MWQAIKQQLPAVIITTVIVTAAALGIHLRTVNRLAANQRQEISMLQEQTSAELKAASAETRSQIDAVNTLLKDAIQKRNADIFMTDAEVAKMNTDRMNQLADTIAQKVQPYNPLPKTPEEAEQQQKEQVDRVSTRLAERIQPILADMSKDQNLTREQIATYSQRISDQIGSVLVTELASKQQLNNNLAAMTSVAQDSMRLSQKVTALYLSSFKDQALVTRLLTLPANVVRDVAHLSIVDSAERKRLETQLVAEMDVLQRRLAAIESQMPQK
jgi:hypothetical protein